MLMYFSMADFTVWESYSCHPFEFPPTTPTEPIFQDLPLPDRQVGSYKLDVLNIAEEVEIHLLDSNLTPDELARKWGTDPIEGRPANSATHSARVSGREKPCYEDNR